MPESLSVPMAAPGLTVLGHSKIQMTQELPILPQHITPHPSHSKSNDTAIDHRAMVTIEPWSIVLSLDFEISWAWSVFLTVVISTLTMEMGSYCRQRANVKECESLLFLYRTVLRLRKIGVLWIRVRSKSCENRALDLMKNLPRKQNKPSANIIPLSAL